MAKTVKEAKADIFLRDTDSQSLFNNEGVLTFKYFHEWNDCYNENTGETAQINGEVYNETTEKYEPNVPTDYKPIFNGRLSALWDNISSQFSSEIQDMYKTMRDNGLSYKDMLAKYKDFWKYWCENLYNADAFGYANTGHFTKAYGDKVQVMDYFYGKRERYMDSKYQCGSSSSNFLQFRVWGSGNGLATKYYQGIYSTSAWGGNIVSARNINPGTYSYTPYSFLSSPSDGVLKIYDADLITELSTYTKSSSGTTTIGGIEGLGSVMFDSNMSLLKRLTKFVMNYTATSPNTYEQGNLFDLSSMSLLKQVIVRYVTNLKKSIVLTSDMIEEIDFTGTPIAGVQTPPSDTLTKLVLPDSITELRLVGYSNLQTSGLQVAGYSNIVTLDIEDCPNLNSYDIMTSCYNAAGEKLSTITLKGINWSLSNLDMLLLLAKRKATLTGKINLGSTTLGINDKVTLMEAWGEIDNENNSLYISYESHSVTSVSISGADYASKTGEYQLAIATKPSDGNNVKSVSWAVEENDFATIDSATGLLTVSKTGSSAKDDKIIVSVSVGTTNNTTLKATKEIRVYKRPIKVGDYVFSDGTHGPTKADGNGCSPVGVCFYVEPNDGEWGLAVSLSTMAAVPWGLYNDSNNGITNISLTDNPSMNGYVYDIQEIINIISGQPANDENMLNNPSDPSQGFKEYLSTQTLGDIGFTSIDNNIYEELKDYLGRAGLQMGDMISAGQLKTLRIIKHRDTILEDSAVNLAVPVAENGKTELQSLNECISAVQSKYGAEKYQQYYYPAASCCFAYAPTILNTGEVLDESVGANHWFLPSIGELERISWYYQRKSENSEYNIFLQALADYPTSFVFTYDTRFFSSTEVSYNSAWAIIVSDGRVAEVFHSHDKYTENIVRPVLAFKR